MRICTSANVCHLTICSTSCNLHEDVQHLAETAFMCSALCRGGMSGSSLGGFSGRGSYSSRMPSAPGPSMQRSHTYISPGPSVGYFGWGAPMVYGGGGVGGGGSALFSFLLVGIFAYVLFNSFFAGSGCAFPARMCALLCSGHGLNPAYCSAHCPCKGS